MGSSEAQCHLPAKSLCPPCSPLVSPRLMALVLSSPDPDRAEVYGDLSILHGECVPEALSSCFPRRHDRHPPLQTPREAPACMTCLHREGTWGYVLGEGTEGSRGCTGGDSCPPAWLPAWPGRFTPSVGTPQRALLRLRGSLDCLHKSSWEISSAASDGTGHQFPGHTSCFSPPRRC